MGSVSLIWVAIVVVALTSSTMSPLPPPRPLLPVSFSLRQSRSKEKTKTRKRHRPQVKLSFSLSLRNVVTTTCYLYSSPLSTCSPPFSFFLHCLRIPKSRKNHQQVSFQVSTFQTMGSPRLKVLILMICISVVLGLDFVEGRFIVEKSSISIVSPYSMHAKYDASIGNFGVPDYGGSLVGTVVYPQKGAFGCSAFEGDKPFKSKTPRPNILLLDRGGNRIFIFVFVLFRENLIAIQIMIPGSAN